MIICKYCLQHCNLDHSCNLGDQYKISWSNHRKKYKSDYRERIKKERIRSISDLVKLGFNSSEIAKQLKLSKSNINRWKAIIKTEI
jgi:DNA-binding NarL/FixJ family response regulator